MRADNIIDQHIRCNHPVCQDKYCTPSFMHLKCKSKFCQVIDENRQRIRQHICNYIYHNRRGRGQDKDENKAYTEERMANHIKNYKYKLYCIICNEMDGSENWTQLNTWWADYYKYWKKAPISTGFVALENMIDVFKGEEIIDIPLVAIEPIKNREMIVHISVTINCQEPHFKRGRYTLYGDYWINLPYLRKLVLLRGKQ